MSILRNLPLAALALLPLLAGGAEVSTPVQSACTSQSDPELADLIQRFSKRTGRKFIIDPRVRAIPGFAGIDADKLTYEQLLALMTSNMFATAVQGDLTLVVPDANARQLPTPVYTDAHFKAADDEWVTLLLTPKKTCAAYLVPILRPLMPQAAHLAADPQSGSLVIVDRAANVRRLADLIDKLDKASTGKQDCGAGGSSKSGS